MKAERKRRKSPARKDALLRRFEATVGRDGILEALDWSADQPAVALAAMLYDPVYRRFSFAKLCQRVGLRYQDVFDSFRRYSLDIALLRVSRHLPEIVEDTVMDARSTERTCTDCDGMGKRDGKPCSYCQGKSTIRVPGDMTCRNIIWNMIRRHPSLLGSSAR